VRWWQWVLIGLLVTAGIETLQGVFLRGRDAQLHDLVANTLGAALGSGAAVVWRRARERGVASSVR
jgi:glycopeptide antibiotics resistance protein